jgi:molybdenum cofactor guanylyltransferase
VSIGPIYGLILAGGASKRMQRDKAALRYQGKTQLARAFELASRHVDKVFVSLRADQTSDPTRAQWPMIVDIRDGEGPIVGIRAALATHP